MIGIGLRIKELREAKNLTQNEFCDKIGIKQTNLSHIENKGIKISVGIISKIVSNFDISATWLLTGEGDMLKKDTEQLSVDVMELLREKDRQIAEKDAQIKRLFDLLEKK